MAGEGKQFSSSEVCRLSGALAAKILRCCLIGKMYGTKAIGMVWADLTKKAGHINPIFWVGDDLFVTNTRFSKKVRIA